MSPPLYTPLWYRQLMADPDFKRRCLHAKAQHIDLSLPLHIRLLIAEYLLDTWHVGMYYQMIELGEL